MLPSDNFQKMDVIRLTHTPFHAFWVVDYKSCTRFAKFICFNYLFEQITRKNYIVSKSHVLSMVSVAGDYKPWRHIRAFRLFEQFKLTKSSENEVFARCIYTFHSFLIP